MSGSAPSAKPRALLRDMFDAAIASAQPAKCIPAHLPAPPRGRLIVIGAGKASAAMASAVEQHWSGPLSGLVVTRYGYAVPCERIEIVESAHPVPDAAGLGAARRMLERVQALTEEDLVLCLFSGGGSALLPLPAAGLTLDLKQAMSRALLTSGATISEMNCVRRHLSAIKGGRLGAACWPAQVLTLLISDVPGDRPIDIASGPTVADPTSCADALRILIRYGIDIPPAVRELLEAGKTWKAYAESIPSVGYLGGDATGPDGGQFYTHHVPLPYMADVQNSPVQRQNIVPFTQFAVDLASNGLPNYSFITPNGCDDAHDCSLDVADNWLKTNIGPLIQSALFQKDGLLIIVFDESSSDNTNGGGQVPAIVVSPFAKLGFKSTTLYQHESVLRLTLEGLGVTILPAAAASAPAMWEFFTFTPPT